MKYEPKLEKNIMCPVEFGLDQFVGKWKSRIICVLSSEDCMRYSEVRKVLNNISDAVLASMLKELVQDDFVHREQYNEIPPKVEYSLTEKGRSVLPILQSICQWSRTYSADHLEQKLPSCLKCDQLP